MKKALLLFAAILTLGSANAQTPDYDVCPDFTITDLNGETYNLYSMLDSGYTVVLDLYAVWCGPCWDYHQAGTLDNLYNQYGPDGTNELRVFGIESDPSTPASTITGGGNSIGNWLTVDYPMANDDVLNGTFNQGYYPTIVTICPDRSVTESGQASVANHYAIASACPDAATDPNDGAIIAYEGGKVVCGDVPMAAILQNKGTEPLTTATIKVMDGGTELSSYDWTGNLDAYQFTEVNLGEVTIPSAGNYSVEISGSDANNSNNDINVLMINPETIGTTIVTLTLVTDDYGVETSWEMKRSDGVVIANGSGYGNNATISETFNLDNNDCYTFTIYDEFGDGICCQYGDGSYVLKTGSGDVIAQGGNFSDDETVGIITDEVAGVNDLELVNHFNFFPNPVTENGTLVFNTTERGNVSFEIMNALGAQVFSKDLGNLNPGAQTIPMSVEGLSTGIYMINLKVNDSVYSTRISVAK